MRPAIEVWRDALDATGCFIRFRNKPEQKAAAVIEAYAAEREAAAHAKAVAEIVADLRTKHGFWTERSAQGKYFADHIETKFGGRDDKK